MIEFNPGSGNMLSYLFFGATIKVTEKVPDRDELGTHQKYRTGQKIGQLKYKNIEIERRIKGLGLKPNRTLETKKEGIYKTDESVLSLIAKRKNHDAGKIAELVLRIRYLQKQISTYYNSTEEVVYDFDSCVHHELCHFGYDAGNDKAGGGVISGRLSGRNPNMLNQPKPSDSVVKQHFIARNGLWISADFCSIEPVAQAELSRDPKLIEDIENGRDEHCVEETTEILTEFGWTAAKNLRLEDKIMSLNLEMQQLELVSILNLWQTKNVQLLELEGSLHNEVVSYSHKILLDGVLTPLSDLCSDRIKQTRFTYSARNHKTSSPYSDDEVRLLIWVLTDGYINLRNSNKKLNGVRWRLSKPRKIKVLCELLETLNIKYSLKPGTKSGLNKLQPYVINIYGEYSRWIFNEVRKEKKYPQKLLEISEEQAKIVFDTLSITDGQIAGKHLEMCSTNIEGLELLQLLFFKNNIACKLRFKQYEGGFKNRSRTGYLYAYPTVYNRQYVSIKHLRLGSVVGIENKNGTLITRRNFKIQVTGNCKYLALKERLPYDVVHKKCKIENNSEWNEKRSKIKAFTFKRKYGGGAKSISEATGLTIDEVKDIFQEEEKTYPVLMQYQNRNKKIVEAHGELKTIFGRVLKFNKYEAFDWQKQKGIFETYKPTEIVNWPIQSTGSGDLTLIMIGHFWRKYGIHNRDKYLMVNTVYDSLDLDCKPEYAEELKEHLKCLTDVKEVLWKYFKYEWVVPVSIDIKQGDSWYAAGL